MTLDPSRTIDYRPPVVVVAGSAPVSDHDLIPLLHKRLRFLVLVFVAFYSVVVLVRVAHPGRLESTLDDWANAATVGVLLGLLALLSGRRRRTLLQLRVVEFVLFAVIAGRVLFRGYMQFWYFDYLDRVHAWIAAGDEDNARQMLFGLAHRLMLVSTMAVVAYGVIIPNTWQRCAIVVAAFTALPVVLWVVGCVNRGLPPDYWLTFGFTISVLVSVQIAILAVYGAYRIESSRQEASEARRLGQYVLREKTGGGGMGEVYLAEHSLLRRPCAIKLIRPERAGDPANLARFEREVRATATLTHPNAIQVFDYGRTPDGTFYYVMEYLPGLTLDELVTRHGPVPPGRAVHFLRQLCGALREAHGIGLIHRDIKPGNVMICHRGGVPDVAKLLDFGLVQSGPVDPGDDRLTREGMVVGTPAYLSPEQAGGGAVDARSDVYSLGALAYFLLTGRAPFAGRSAVQVLAAHLYELPAPPADHQPDVPADLQAVVLRCLAKKPADRFPDVASLDAALAGCQSAGRWSEPDAAGWWRQAAG